MIDDTRAFLERVNRTKAISLKLAESLTGSLTINRLEAGETFLSPGNYARGLYFIQNGLLKGSVEGAKGKVTTWFRRDGDLLLPQSLFNRQPSPEYVSTVTESTLYVLPLSQLQKLITAFPEAAELFLLMAWETIKLGQYREYLLRIPAAKDRFTYFVEHEGYLLKNTPHHLIASYLNVTRETFSRIHKGLAY